MKTRIAAWGLVALLAGLAVGERAEALYKARVIFRKGPNTWVKITRANKRILPLEHPKTFTSEQMAAALASLCYFRPDAFGFSSKKGKEYALFTEEEIRLIAAPAAQALGQAGPEEWVDFSVYAFRGQNLLGTFRQTDGVIFVKNGRLNVALRNIAEKTGTDQQTLNTYDPTRGYRSLTRLVAIPGQEQVGKNWVTMDPARIPKPAKPAAPEGVAPAAAGPAPAPSASAAQEQPQRSVEERLRELQDLYDKGLITEEEYRKKREEILNGL